MKVAIHLGDVADKLIATLKEKGFHVMVYRSKSSKSAYIKLDYGVNHTIRLSDHEGKKHLAFKYNLLKGIETPYSTFTEHGHLRHFYPVYMADQMVKDIVRSREMKMTEHGVFPYMGVIERKKADVATKPQLGFWRVAVEA